MKTVVFLLALGNLLFYAFSAGYLGRPENPDAGRVNQQVAPERIRLVSRDNSPPSKPVEVPPSKPVEVSPVLTAAEPETPPSAPAVVPNVCLRWSELSTENAGLLSKKIAEKFATFKLAKHVVTSERDGWWVYIPPLPSKAEAEKKAGELRLFGVFDYFIMPEDGPNRYAISLGVFSTEKGGQERMAELKSKRVRSARLVARPGKSNLVTLEARGPLSDKAALLTLVTATLPKTTAQECK